MKNPEYKQRKAFWWRLLQYPVYVAFGLVGAWLLYRSYGIFQTAFNRWGLVSTTAVCDNLGRTPFIGDVLRSGCISGANTVIGLTALVALLAILIFESLPTLLWFHPGSIEDMVYQLRHNRKEYSALSVQQGDSQETQWLVHRHKRLPENAFRSLMIMSVVAFLVEIVIVWSVRGWHTNIGMVLVDSLGFEILLVAVLAFRNVFTAKPPRKYRVVD